MPLIAYFAVALEVGMALAGLFLLWHLVLKSGSWMRRTPAVLPRWDITAVEFLVFILFIIGGAFVLALISGFLTRQLSLRGDAVAVFNGAAAQLGMLGGVVAFWQTRDKRPPKIVGKSPNIFVAGVATFVLSLPLLLLVANLWEFVLKLVGLPTEKQSLIEMFANADSSWQLGTMIILAIVIAPLTEELVFRAGLFRFLRDRTPRIFALLIASVFFASLHVNWATLEGLSSLAPLVVLAVVFSLAYERTGSIGTSVVAHALFNLNTIILIFSGVEKV
jgi:uncharacterized protein